MLPTELIDGSLLMCHEHLTCSLIELRQIAQTPSCSNGVFHHTPEAFHRSEVVTAARREQVHVPLSGGVVEGRVQLVRPMEATLLGNHHDFFPGVPKDAHHLMDVLAEGVGITMGDDCIDDAGGAVLHGAHDREYDPTGDAAPRTLLRPGLTFEGFFPFDLAWTQRPCRETGAPGASPPALAGQGKAPQEGLIFVEEDELALACTGLQGGQFETSVGQRSGGGSESSSGTAGAQRVFFHPLRTLSRPRGTPVWWASTVASACQLHGEWMAPWARGS
jgi:hypothetical protein